MSIRPFSLIRPNASREPSGDQRGRCSRSRRWSRAPGCRRSRGPRTRPIGPRGSRRRRPAAVGRERRLRLDPGHVRHGAEAHLGARPLERAARSRHGQPRDATAAAARPQGISLEKKARATAAGRVGAARPSPGARAAVGRRPRRGAARSRPCAGRAAARPDARGGCGRQARPVRLASDHRGHHVGQARPVEGAPRRSASRRARSRRTRRRSAGRRARRAPARGSCRARYRSRCRRRWSLLRGRCRVVDRWRSIVQDPGQAEVEQLDLAVAA